ncbi:MAG: hypothetical protein LLG01_14880 [Planctomycetaceae bacterium]|nr:hypothetical protein [Planctomycetaceae bacterium]
MIDEGKAYTSGTSFRARAEAQQRRFRADVLRLGHGDHAHWLMQDDAAQGKNFYGRAHAAVLARAAGAKGVGLDRTRVNMLSSQAMCFNIFGNLQSADGLAVATRALRQFIPSIKHVRQIHLEYTPSNDMLGDQSARGGVDCDVLVEYDTAGGGGLLAIETKFVEEEFSTCGFRKKTASASCREGTCPGGDFSGCLYAARKGYQYWNRSRQMGTLKAKLLRGDMPCPFGGGLWQLWVNHTLVHAEVRHRQLQEATFAVCAPKNNCALLKGGETIEIFQNLLADSRSMKFIALEDLFEAFEDSADQSPFWRGWIEYLQGRYVIVQE